MLVVAVHNPVLTDKNTYRQGGAEIEVAKRKVDVFSATTVPIFDSGFSWCLQLLGNGTKLDDLLVKRLEAEAAANPAAASSCDLVRNGGTESAKAGTKRRKKSDKKRKKENKKKRKVN